MSKDIAPKVLTAILVVCLFAIAFIVVEEVTKPRQMRLGGVIVPGTNCKCYCSDKCGPRDIKRGIDRPFVDSETGLCFCADRDKANYIPNRCTPKAFTNSCCG